MNWFDWKEFKEGNVAVLFRSYDEYKEFAREAHEHDIKWPMRSVLEIVHDPHDLKHANASRPHGVSYCYGALGHASEKYYKTSGKHKTVAYWEDFKMFKKKDFKHGDIITTRDGDKLVVFDEFKAALGFSDNCARKAYYIRLEDIDEELKSHYNKNCDIMKVERPGSAECLFVRDEGPRKVTMAEVNKAFGEEVCIVED